MQQIVARLRAAGCVFAEDEAALLAAEARDLSALHAMVERRVAGEPLEQIVGWAQFGGLRVAVEPGVFVPRRRTEFVVELAVALRPRVVLDLCCGAGAIAAAVAARLPDVEAHAADVDPAAVRCARRNLAGAVYEGDLFEPLPNSLAGRVDVLVANAPYVPTGEIDLMPREAREHEHRLALDGGADGLDIHRRIIAGASSWLAAGGRVLIETSRQQASSDLDTCRLHGFVATIERSDEHDATVLVARRPRERQPKRPCT